MDDVWQSEEEIWYLQRVLDARLCPLLMAQRIKNGKVNVL